MQLIAASNAADDDLRYMVREVKVVRLNYVTTGRNAWWSTWITRYSPGCMHSTLESAKSFYEGCRVQGTVFHIDELPSLAFIAPERSLVISEINTEQFLGRLNLARLQDITTVLPVSTMTLRQMIYMFRPESPLWPSSYPRKDSAILSFCSQPDTLREVQSSEELSSWASNSSGPNYYLSWSRRPFSKDRTVLHGVASTLTGRPSETKPALPADALALRARAQLKRGVSGTREFPKDGSGDEQNTGTGSCARGER